ncbi:protein LNK1 [Telopea speciosissima]|uniref:protein LNK1 n=1 Tax=Telopea speciosissima TaxID=54955 RepID=UPI001CC3D962|nr:protein LNK1 [Telopea speciosissima]XP_043720514.1 protein LNK1 [Telopea speciosissima]XP_043720515.1 protein LNK1 [Telopea speciosissima]
MLDWSTCELEGIVWDEFSENDDHIVPHPGGEEVTGQVDCHKRPRCEVSYPFTSNSNSQYAAKDALHRKDETSFATVKDQKAPMLENGSWSCTTDGVFPASCDPDSIKGMPGLTAVDTKLPGYCFNSNHIDSTSNEFCTDDPILGYRSAAVGSSLCHFPLGDISSTGSDLEFFANEHEDKENSDLLYFGWPDIGNFEDVYKMFRSCDSTFGQGNTSHDDEFSCFSSSSHAIDGSEDALKSGLKSSSSDSNELRSISKHHESDNRFRVDTITPLINDSEENSAPNDYKIDSRVLDGGEPATLGHTAYVGWSDANVQNRWQSSSIEQINLHNQQLKHHNQSEGKGKTQSSEFNSDGPSHGLGSFQQFANSKLPPSMPSSLHAFSALDIPQQQQNLGRNFSSYSHIQLPYVQLKHKNPSHQVPVTPTSSIKTENNRHPSVSSKSSSIASNHAQPMEQSPDSSLKASAMKSEKRVRKPFQQQQLHAKLTGDSQQEDLGMRAACTNQVSNQKHAAQIRDEVGAHSEFEGKGIELPAEDSSTEQQSSCMSSALSDVVSLEKTSFGQLQYIMEQLDVRTKLCIRDSLYRLARSAEQRHNIGSLNGCGRNCSVKTGVLKTEEADNCTRFVDIETDTNPIDRSMAHLLFHRPSEVSTREINGVLSQESHAMLQGSISIQPTMTEELVSSEEIACGAETELHTDL